MVNSGYSQSLYYGNEATYGVAATINKDIGLVQSVNPTESNSLIKIRTMGGTRDYSNIVPGTFEVTGNFDYYVQHGQMMFQAIGQESTTQHGTGSAKLHVLGSGAPVGAASFPSFTLEFADSPDAGGAGTANLKRLFTGCRVNTMSLSASADEPLMASVEFQAQSVTKSTAAASSVTESTLDPFVFYQGMVYATSGAIGATTNLTADASHICEVNSFDWSVNNNLEANWYVSGTCATHETLRGLKSLIPKGRDYEASLDLHFRNKDMYERFLGATGASTPQDTLTGYTVVLDFARSGHPGSSALSTDNWMRIVMPNTKFDENVIAGSPEDTVTQSISLAVESAKIYFVDDIVAY